MKKDEIIKLLRKNKIKITPQRIAIIEFLERNGDHPSADQIYNELKEGFPSMSLATVYNTLEMLENIHEVIRLNISGDPRVYYEYDTDFHHHFYCNECNKIYDVYICCPNEKNKSIEGHKIEEIQAYFKGICRECLNKRGD